MKTEFNEASNSRIKVENVQKYNQIFRPNIFSIEYDFDF